MKFNSARPRAATLINLRVTSLPRSRSKDGGPSLVEAFDDRFKRCADGPGNVAEFYDIESTFAGLVLADERLGDVEPLGDVDLGESSVPAQLPQQRAQLLVLRGIDGLFHPASAPCTC